MVYPQDQLKELDRLMHRIEAYIKKDFSRDEQGKLFVLFAGTDGLWREYQPLSCLKAL